MKNLAFFIFICFFEKQCRNVGKGCDPQMTYRTFYNHNLGAQPTGNLQGGSVANGMVL